MDPSKPPCVIKLAGPVDTQPLNNIVPELSINNQPSTASLTSTASSSSSGEFAKTEKQNTQGKLTAAAAFEKSNRKSNVKVGAEFEVDKDDGRIECGLCKKVYANRKSLKIHMRLHYGIKPYKCSLCPKAFTQACTLKTHINYHTGRQNWVCDTCSKVFTQSAHLRTHRKIHSGQKDYQCPYCQRGYTSKASCDAHVRRHTGERNNRYVCLLCDKFYTRSESLRDHENSKHRKFRPYICSQTGCAKAYSTRSRLTGHVRSAHGAPKS